MYSYVTISILESITLCTAGEEKQRSMRSLYFEGKNQCDVSEKNVSFKGKYTADLNTNF